LNADGILGISERTTFAVNETYIRSQEITDIVNISNFGPISKLVDRQYNNVSGTLTQNIRNDLTLTAGGSYNIIDYKDPQFNNLTAYSGVLGLAYKPSDRMTLALNAVYTVYDFSQNSESTTQQYTLGIQYKLLPTLTMGMTGGAVITEIKDSGGSDIGFAGGIDLTQTFEKGSATVYFKQSVVPDTENGEPVTAQTVGGGISRPFSEKSTSFVSASYTKYKSAVSGGGVNQDSIYVNGGLDYKVAKWADLSLAYSYIKSNDKEINPRNYVNNIIALTLKVHYGKEPQSWSQTKEALR
jgi:predicted porin